MTYNKRERECYNNHRIAVCEVLGITKNQYNWFRRMGQGLHNIYENSCNGLLTESQYEFATDHADREVTEYIKKHSLNLFIYYQTDPRGASIYLDVKPIERNAYTNAQCIY